MSGKPQKHSIIKEFLFHEGMAGFLVHLLFFIICSIFLFFGVLSVFTFDGVAGSVIILGVVIFVFLYFKKKLHDFDFDRRVKKMSEEESGKENE